MSTKRVKTIATVFVFWWTFLPWLSLSEGHESSNPRGQGRGNRSGGIGPSWCCGRWFG